MRTRIVITMLLVSFGTCAFAATKKSVLQPPSSTGILIASTFGFTILGDGISTTFTITPWRIPQGSALGLPLLPLVGVENGGGSCGLFGQILFTATVSGRQVIVTLASPMAAGDQENCSATLLFHPE